MPVPTRWHVVMVWCPDLVRAHDKFCICLCPHRHWYYFVNTDPPYTRLARKLVLPVPSFQLHFLTHDSFIDTTSVQKQLDASSLAAAWANPARYKGMIPPSLINTIKQYASSHNVLSPEELDAVLNP